MSVFLFITCFKCSCIKGISQVTLMSKQTSSSCSMWEPPCGAHLISCKSVEFVGLIPTWMSINPQLPGYQKGLTQWVCGSGTLIF